MFTQYQRLYEGWNNIFFNGDGYTITGDETLFFGFNYNETEEMVNAEIGGICCFDASSDGGFVIEISNDLYPVSGAGDLAVQLIVDMASIPTANMAVALFDTGFKYKTKDNDLDFFYTLRNVGREEINNFTMNVTFDGKVSVEREVELTIPAGQSDNYEMIFPVPEELGMGMHTVVTSITKINGKDSPDPSITAKSGSFALYENSFDRNKVYVEVYSNQLNAYSSKLDGIMKLLRDDMNEMTTIVQVHSPVTTLAAPQSSWLHGVYSYVTPSFTINRSYFPGEAHIAYDLNDYFSILPPEFTIAIVEDMVAQDYYNPAFVTLDLDAVYDPETRKLNVTASGDVLPEAKLIYGDMALSLMLVQDGIKSRQDTFNGNNVKPDLRYEHNNVLKGYLTPDNGTPMEVKDGKYSVELSTTVPDNFDMTKGRITAIITKAGEFTTEEEAKAFDVINAADFNLSEISDVSEIEVAPQAKEIEGIYSIDGMRLDSKAASAPGLHIVRYTDGTSRKMMVK